MCILAIGTSAATFLPDDDGMYEVSLDMTPNSEYIMFVLKGTYDQTNYVEAYNNSDDSDILYFEQSTSNYDGTVTFGPFVPNGYYDATLIVGGTDLAEPYLAGYLSAEGASNCANIVISGVNQRYTVAGVHSFDYVIEVETEVLDSFGYPSVTNEQVELSLLNNSEDISIDGNTITIGKTAKEQAFTVVAAAGGTTETVYVQIVRETPVYDRIEVYADKACTESISEISVIGTAGNYPSVTVYAKTFDQYGDEIDDTYTYNYGGRFVESTFSPSAGSTYLTVGSKNSVVSKDVYVVTTTRPDYKGSALELYELIEACNERLSEDKNISTNGKDVYPDEAWTTSDAVRTFGTAINTAKTALSSYGSAGYSDDDYEDEITALTKALTTFNNSFKAGSRVDLETMAFEEESAVITVNGTVELAVTTTPKIGLTTDVVTWKSSDETIVTVTDNGNGKAEIKGIASGKAIVTATSRSGLTDSIEVTVIKKATDIVLKSSADTAKYRGTPVVLSAQIKPTGCTDVITWTVAKPEVLDLVYNEYIDEDGYRWVEATVLPKSAGKTRITVTAQYGNKTKEKDITVVMPDWETAEKPTANVASGSVLKGTQISLSSPTGGAAIYYTLDGTTPSMTNGREYKAPIALTQSLTLKAIAVIDGMYDSEVVTYEYKVVASAVRASSGIVRRGDDIDITISVEDLVDIKQAVINVAFDNTVLDWKDTEFLCGHVDELNSSFGEPEAKIVLNYKGDGTQEAFSYDGDVIKLTFRVREEAAEGKYYVSVSADNILKADDSTYDAASFDGTVVVNDYILGDANNDGAISLADVLIIKQYAAGKEYAVKNILLNASDVDADGDVDEDDAILVSKYCVGWNVTFGKQPEDVSSYRIISSYDVGLDADENWRYYYEVYNPLTGLKTSDIPSVKFDGKASNLTSTPALKEGTVVKITEDAMIDDSASALVGSINLASCVWIKSANENAMVVVPVDNTLECKNCATEYVENYSGTTYNDFLGNKQQSNVVTVTEDTAFVIMEYSSLGSSFLKWSTIKKIGFEDVIEAKNYIRCYNDKSVDRDDNYETTYADYVKALVCANESGEAEFVIVVKNGDDAAAYNVPCDNCK